MARRTAVIDIGTNTLLLLVTEATDGGTRLTKLRDESRFGRLGKGLDASGNLSPESIERSLDIVREYRAIIDELEVEQVAVVGTQALREAGNAAAFVEPAQELLGAAIQVIPGEREAELVALSVARSLPELSDQTFAIADVGGGSTEVIVTVGGEVKSFKSIRVGAVRFTERYLKDDPPTAEQARAMIEGIDRALDELELPTAVPLVGTAGTSTNMAAVELKLRVFDGDRVQGFRLTPAIVERQLARYLELEVSERKRLVGLDPNRADLIAAGAAIYARLLHRMQAPEMVVSDRGVRWGLAHELAETA